MTTFRGETRPMPANTTRPPIRRRAHAARQHVSSLLSRVFAPRQSGPPFRLFSRSHLAALGVHTLLNLSLLVLRAHPPAPHTRRLLRTGLATTLLVNEAAWHIWHWKTGQWRVQTMLPLHLCSVMVFHSAVMLLTRSYTLYEVAYFLGPGGAIQGLLTPDLGCYRFPHFRYFQTFISHGGIVTASLYMTLVEGYRPTPQSLVRVIVGIHPYMLLVVLVNRATGGNYLYLAHKPEIPTLIDHLGPWPWYILSIEAIGLATMLLLYLPFALHDWKTQTHNTTMPPVRLPGALSQKGVGGG